MSYEIDEWSELNRGSKARRASERVEMEVLQVV